jgi:ribosome biogenesis GTPase
MRLGELGWDDVFERHFEPWRERPDVQPGRVAIEFNHLYRLYVEEGELEAAIGGRVKHHALSRSELPAVGDWVVVRTGTSERRGSIRAVLPRRSRFSRRAAGNVTDEQVVAANVDTVFLVMSLDNNDFSIRRLERYLLLARESGASPVILLTKPDLCEDAAARVAEVAATGGDLPVHLLNPKKNEGIERVAGYLGVGRTGALLGSSGVGKSTIINRLIGEDVQKTREVRESDSKGRHTTTRRELLRLPNGSIIIDTPGMRELQLWDVGEAVRETFDEIVDLAPRCFFSNCRHRDEPRCAVKAAVAEGRLAASRLESYLKLQDELASLARRQDVREQLEERRRSKVLSRAIRARQKQKGR